MKVIRFSAVSDEEIENYRNEINNELCVFIKKEDFKQKIRIKNYIENGDYTEDDYLKNYE